MDALTAEEKLARWAGNVTGMQDHTFRTRLPRGIREGLEVKLVSGTPGTFNQLNEFTFELKGISPDRKALMERIEKICDQLPLQQQQDFVYVALKEEIEFSLEEKEGMQLFSALMQLTASFA
jgi:hypothetical protein